MFISIPTTRSRFLFRTRRSAIPTTRRNSGGMHLHRPTLQLDEHFLKRLQPRTRRHRASNPIALLPRVLQPHPSRRPLQKAINMNQETAEPCSYAEAAVAAGTPPTAAQKISALIASRPFSDPRKPVCCGTVYVGMFFDGTGNNRDKDYVKPPPEERKHSNVVRLYHAYPDRVKKGTDSYYGFYIPGVGTPFTEIGDLPLIEVVGQPFGAGFAAMGEARINWGITRIFNAVHDHIHKTDFVDDVAAGWMSKAVRLGAPPTLTREQVFKQTWQPKLAAAIRNLKPEVERIVIDVFGFSRGAAQARTFVNWLYELCEREGTGTGPGATYRFAGIPLQVRFMGLFDTVASVGLAGLSAGGPFDNNGHLSWASGTQQIHPHVERYVHYVAAHEVRGCFPSDSVRIDGRYPANAKEWVYPGAHSDVGGGYGPKAQGKTDALARVPGYAMYREALAFAVPLNSEQWLKKARPDIYEDLAPTSTTIEAFNNYRAFSKAAPAPVEQQHRHHMTLYFRYRAAAVADYDQRPFFRNADKKAQLQLAKTQRDFMANIEHATNVGHMRGSARASFAGLAQDPVFSLQAFPWEKIRIHFKGIRSRRRPASPGFKRPWRHGASASQIPAGQSCWPVCPTWTPRRWWTAFPTSSAARPGTDQTRSSSTTTCTTRWPASSTCTSMKWISPASAMATAFSNGAASSSATAKTPSSGTRSRPRTSAAPRRTPRAVPGRNGCARSRCPEQHRPGAPCAGCRTAQPPLSRGRHRQTPRTAPAPGWRWRRTRPGWFRMRARRAAICRGLLPAGCRLARRPPPPGRPRPSAGTAAHFQAPTRSPAPLKPG